MTFFASCAGAFASTAWAQAFDPVVAGRVESRTQLDELTYLQLVGEDPGTDSLSDPRSCRQLLKAQQEAYLERELLFQQFSVTSDQALAPTLRSLDQRILARETSIRQACEGY